MLKTSRILLAQVFYHGQNMTRPYTGKYLFLTADPAYASSLSSDGKIQKFEVSVPTSKLWSMRKISDLEALTKAIQDPDAIKKITESTLNGEMDWSVYEGIRSPEYSDPESLFKSLGYRGVWLSEKGGAKSILLFDSQDAQMVGEDLALYKKQRA